MPLGVPASRSSRRVSTPPADRDGWARGSRKVNVIEDADNQQALAEVEERRSPQRGESKLEARIRISKRRR